MRKLLPFIMGVLGLLAGGGTGYVLRPHQADPTTEGVAVVPQPETPEGHAAPQDHAPETDHAVSADAHDTGHAESSDHPGATEYVKLNNQFVVPVISEDEVSALVILSLTLAVKADSGGQVFSVEPKLRDSFLQVLFDYANADGFSGAFTQSGRMDRLRKALLEAARGILGETVGDVLIVDIVRQDN